jgi:hypothetical protein
VQDVQARVRCDGPEHKGGVRGVLDGRVGALDDDDVPHVRVARHVVDHRVDDRRLQRLRTRRTA